MCTSNIIILALKQRSGSYCNVYLRYYLLDLDVLHAGVGNLVNAILDAIFVFPLGLGVRGAALATVTSEYVKAIMRI